MEPITDRYLKRKMQRWEYLLMKVFIDTMAEHLRPPRPMTTDAIYDTIDKCKEFQDIPIFYLNKSIGGFLKSHVHAGRLIKLKSYSISRRTNRPLVEYMPVSKHA